MQSLDDPNTSASFTEDIFCPRCTYNLRGTTGDRCPECGYSVEAMRRGEVRIPWERRREVGRLRAYCQTAWMMTFHPRSIAECMAGEVSYRDAQRFRWLTVLMAVAYVTCGTLLTYDLQLVSVTGVVNPNMRWRGVWGQPSSEPPLLARAYNEIWPVVLANVCLAIFLATATCAAGYFFRAKSLSPRQSNNALAMSNYTCGPLAISFIPVAILVVMIATVPLGDPYTMRPLMYGAGLTAAVIVLMWWVTIVRSLRAALPRFRGQWIAAAVCVPLIWGIFAVLAFLVLPTIVAYILVIIDSLRP